MIGIEDVEAARDVVKGRIHRTPLVRSSTLGERFGVELWFKLEPFQKTGSFKVRGVLNKLARMSEEERSRGVVTLSAGNHAQALAWAAAREGMEAIVVMPAGAVRSKVEATRAYGGEVVLTEGDLLETCLAIREERGLTLVHPFDDPAIIAGQGTVGLEILEDLPELDAVFAGVGGGGLVSGIATAVKARRPEARVIGVEPEGAAAMRAGLDAGEPVRLESMETVADGLAAPFAGRHTLAHVQARVDAIEVVPDAAIVEAMRLVFDRVKVVAEPAAAASLAGLAAGRVPLTEGAAVACVLSGGNIDTERLVKLLG
ncbi:MAG: pyridoxal-phosphate dependent enzyme [Gemmatimonadetes bacterium]|nr:pyridoxal-phosphate dependent enzyme [Gemmatimonadota bacterium]